MYRFERCIGALRIALRASGRLLQGTKRKRWRSIRRKGFEGRARMDTGVGLLKGPINEWPPAADHSGPNQTRGFDSKSVLSTLSNLFYVMPATPESISRGTLLFCVCMRGAICIGWTDPIRKLICKLALGPRKTPTCCWYPMCRCSTGRRV